MITLTKDSPLKIAEDLIRSGKAKDFGNQLIADRKAGKASYLKDKLAEFGVTSYADFFTVLESTLNVDLSATIRQLDQTLPDLGYRWLVPEIITEAIRRGVRRAAFYPEWTTAKQTVNNIAVVMPNFDLLTSAPGDLPEGKTIPITEVVYDVKTIYLKAKGLGIRLSYEAVMFCSIDLAAVWFEDFGVQLGRVLDAAWVANFLQGDLDQTGSVVAGTAPATIGVLTGGTGITDLDYVDIMGATLRMSACGYNPTAIICNLTAASRICALTEFTTRALGLPLVALETRGFKLPGNYILYADENVTAGYIIMLNTARTSIQYTAQELLVENKRYPENRTVGDYASIITGPAIQRRGGRVVINSAATLAAAPWPSWYTTTSTNL